MLRTGCNVLTEEAITRLICRHAEALAPYLEWDPVLAARALDILDDELDTYLAAPNDPEATQIGHEIARVLLRAVLTRRAFAFVDDPVAKRAC